jgi:DNA repair exonuclease SbcCD ATPase subunit
MSPDFVYVAIIPFADYYYSGVAYTVQGAIAKANKEEEGGEVTNTYEDYHILKQKYEELLDDFNDLEHNMNKGADIFVAQRESIQDLEDDLAEVEGHNADLIEDLNACELELADVLGALSEAQDKIDLLTAQLDALTAVRSLH